MGRLLEASSDHRHRSMSERKASTAASGSHRQRNENNPLKAFLFAHSDSARPLRTLLPEESGLGSLPLLNIPIIAYQLDALVRGGVTDVTILTSRDPSMLRSILEPTISGEGPCGEEYEIGGMAVRVLCDEGWHSDGDALREVDTNTDLRPEKDFLLISAGAICNLNIQSLMGQHEERRKEDRSWMMTSVFRRGGQSLTRSTLTIVLDGQSNTLLKYMEAYTGDGLAIDTASTISSFKSGGTVNIFTDIVDCGVDVCAPELMVEFRENPDYDRLRDYVRNKLDGGEAEVLGNRICAYLTNSSAGEYAAIIDSAAAYDSIAGDILAGWLAPLTPDHIACGLGLTIPVVKCLSKRNHVYVSYPRDATAHRVEIESLEKLRDCVISSSAEIGAGAVVHNSVLGPCVTIGSGAEILFSHLMDNVEVRHGASIRSSILGTNSVVGRQCVVPPGCVLGPRTKIGSHFHLKPGTWTAVRVYTKDKEGSEDEWNSESTDSDHIWDEEEVGSTGVGALVPGGGKGDPFSDWNSASWGLKYGSENDDSQSESGYQLEIVDGARGQINRDSDGRDEGGRLDRELDTAESEENRFQAEIRENLHRCLDENVDIDNLAMEINSLKLVFDKSIAETCNALVQGILEVERNSRTDSSRVAIFTRLQGIVSKWKPLLDRYDIKASEEDEAMVIEKVRKFLQGVQARGEMFMDVLRILYDEEIVSEDGVERWKREEEGRMAERSSDGRYFEAARDFFDWLDQAEEESDEDAQDNHCSAKAYSDKLNV